MRQPLLVVVPWVSLLALLVGWLLAPAALERLTYLPLLVSTVLFGIPHGALDHRVPGRLAWAWSRRPGLVGLYVLGYALLAAATLWLWQLAPEVVFWGFLLVSLLHWGQGDLHYLETVEPLLRHSAHLELDTSRLSVAEVSDRLEALRHRHVRDSVQPTGYGLGLSIVGTIVERQRGRLELLSPPPGGGTGLEARITLAPASEGSAAVQLQMS